MALPSTVAEARKCGACHYFTGRPCVRGHVAKRVTSSKDCVECVRAKYAVKYARIKENQNRRQRERYASDPAYRARRQATKTPAWKERAKDRKRERYRTDPAYRERLLAARRGRDQRNSCLKFHYGITVEDYQRLFAEQGGVCAICGRATDRTLHVDHNANTGVVRQLLCAGCNLGLGCFIENPAALRAAAEYLEKHNAA